MELELDNSNVVDTYDIDVFSADPEKKIISADKFVYELKLRITDIDDPKELKKFIRKCENLIRQSPEYKLFTTYVREVLEVHRCQITGEFHEQTNCDIHHHPFCLYTLVKGIVCKNMETKKEFCSWDVCLEAIELHYGMKAPFCSLVRSLHDKFHNGFMKIPIELVNGDKKFFLDTYGKYLEDDDLSPIYDRLKTNWNNCGWSKDKYWGQDLKNIEEHE